MGRPRSQPAKAEQRLFIWCNRLAPAVLPAGLMGLVVGFLDSQADTSPVRHLKTLLPRPRPNSLHFLLQRPRAGRSPGHGHRRPAGIWKPASPSPRTRSSRRSTSSPTSGQINLIVRPEPVERVTLHALGRTVDVIDKSDSCLRSHFYIPPLCSNCTCPKRSLGGYLPSSLAVHLMRRHLTAMTVATYCILTTNPGPLWIPNDGSHIPAGRAQRSTNGTEPRDTGRGHPRGWDASWSAGGRTLSALPTGVLAGGGVPDWTSRSRRRLVRWGAGRLAGVPIDDI